MIRSGSKTVTRRESKPRVRPGNTYIAAYNRPDLDKSPIFTSHEEADCYIRVTALYQEPLGEVTDEDAQQEGDYESVEEFIEGYEAVYEEGAWDPEKTVWVVEFEYVGRTLKHISNNKKNGMDQTGSKNYNCKLDEDKVREIKTRLANDEHRSEIASDYGVSKQTIAKIAKGRSWTHVDRSPN